MTLPQWSNVLTDGPSMADFDEAFANLEKWAARDEQGTMAQRPSPGVRGRFYTATETGAVYRDTGTAWQVVGAVVAGQTVTAGAAGSVAQVVRGAAGQGANLSEWQDAGGAVLARVGAAGGVVAVGPASRSAFGGSFISGVALAGIASAAGLVPLVARGSDGQTANLQEWQAGDGSVLASVGPGGGVTARALASDGVVSAPRLRLTDVTDVTPSSTFHALQIGASSASNLRMDNNEIGAFASGAPAYLGVQSNGGDLALWGADAYGDHALQMRNRVSATNPPIYPDGGVLYVQLGRLYFRGGQGTITMVAAQ